MAIPSSVVYIADLRGSSSRRESDVNQPPPPSPRILPALITESEHIGDDWLVDDVRSGLKRKLSDVDSVLKDINIRTTEKKRNRPQQIYGSSSGSGGRMSELRTSVDNEDLSVTAQVFDSESRPRKHTVIEKDDRSTSVREVATSRAALQRQKQTRLTGSSSVVAAVTQSVTPVKSKCDERVVTSTTAINPPAAPPSVPNPLRMRLKVRVGDQLILVPVLERSVTLPCVNSTCTIFLAL